MIKFITETEEEKPPVFGDVEMNQFFEDARGRLCQKYNVNIYYILTRPDGAPYTDRMTNVRPDMPITRILPRVTKIEWGE
jgi:hypothetical protein